MNRPDIGLCWGTVHQTTLVECIELAGRFGFPTISITPDIYLAALENGESANQIRLRLADAGVRVSLIDAITAGVPGMQTDTVMFRGQPVMRHDATACIAVANAVEAPVVNLSHYLGSPVPLDRIADSIAAICRDAAESGITVVLEFVPESGIGSLAEAAAIAQACGEPNCGIMLDTWHLARSGGTAQDILALPPGSIGAFQLSDRVEPEPGATYVPMTGRLLPGEGELPLSDIVRAALNNSPDVPIEIEVFSEELAAMTAEAATSRVASAVAAWDFTSA